MKNIFPIHDLHDNSTTRDPFEDVCLPVFLHNDISPSVPLETIIPNQEEVNAEVENDHSQPIELESVDPVATNIIPRKSTRKHVSPAYLQEYHYSLLTTGLSYHSKHTIDKVLNYGNFFFSF